MKIRIAGVVDESIVDGPGFRFAVFCQGCRLNCPGCHNPQTHDFVGGYDADTDDIIKKMRDNILLDGLTLTGGDPFEQPIACETLAGGAKALGLNVWAYSGYTFEELLDRGDCRGLLEMCDVLVDGPFIMAERTLELRFRGSKNQRLIDVKKSLESSETVIYDLEA
ncbi:MAG: anaerobic ribonucleoside-triphosphate reductase activating protein [Clostridia bacterium]|nr:anaerobic ribonucleoside-triphosphate reductase activating protein [Clostridia bacterium]